MSRKTLLFAIAAVSLFAAGSVYANPPTTPPGQDRDAELRAKGWQRVTEGVLQRNLGGDKVETFAFGREGFEWMVQNLENRLGFLLREYKKYPGNNELRKTIVDLRQQISRTKNDLRTTDFSQSFALGPGEPIGGEELANCDIQYGAHADAYYLITSQGVGASADAYFRNNCFYWGRAAANVYVRATVGGVTTSDTAAGTQDGERVEVAKALTRNGGEDCYSTAWASASSAGLGIVYETSDSNDDCPPPPLTISLNGPSSIFVLGYDCNGGDWYASVSGGIPPYTINWYRNGYFVGSGSSYYDFFCGSNSDWTDYFTLSATASDSGGSTPVSANQGVWVYYNSIYVCEQTLSRPLECPIY